MIDDNVFQEEDKETIANISLKHLDGSLEKSVNYPNMDNRVRNELDHNIYSFFFMSVGHEYIIISPPSQLARQLDVHWCGQQCKLCTRS